MINWQSTSRVLVLGYGISSKSVIELLIKKGIRVRLNNQSDLSKDESVIRLKQKGVEVIDGGHPLSVLDGIDWIVKSPIIPYELPLIQEALQQNIPIYTDVELAYQLNQSELIAVTGSNGKTTTVSLIQKILDQGLEGNSYAAGNIGIPAIDVVQKAKAVDQVVMELSSFQLLGIDQLRPHIARFTNIYEAHLDYHKTRQAYIEAKLNLIRNLKSQDYLVYNADQEELASYFEDCPARKVPFSRKLVIKEGAYCLNGYVYFQDKKIMKLEEIPLPGEHNVENVLAAVAVASIENVKPEIIRSVVMNFEGIAHRIQWVGKYHKADFYNDSKATNPLASLTALRSFKDRDIVYFAGGLDRGNDFQELEEEFKKVKAAYLFGQSAKKIYTHLKVAEVPIIFLADTLEQAFKAFYDYPLEDEVVLFSPACASWDQYPNYEVRGKAFCELVKGYLEEKEKNERN